MRCSRYHMVNQTLQRLREALKSTMMKRTMLSHVWTMEAYSLPIRLQKLSKDLRFLCCKSQTLYWCRPHPILRDASTKFNNRYNLRLLVDWLPTTDLTRHILLPRRTENLFPLAKATKSRIAPMTAPHSSTAAWALMPQVLLRPPTYKISPWWLVSMKLLDLTPRQKNMIWLTKEILRFSEVRPRTTKYSRLSSISRSISLSMTTSMSAWVLCSKRQRRLMPLTVTSSVVRERTKNNLRFSRMNSKRTPTGHENISDASLRSSASASAKYTSGTGTRERKRAWQLVNTSIEGSEANGCHQIHLILFREVPKFVISIRAIMRVIGTTLGSSEGILH